jgi:hypothetical protein
MQFIRFHLSALGRAVRFLVAIFACALLVFSSAAPAYSIPNPFAGDDSAQTSEPTEGEESLTGIEKESQKMLYEKEPVAPKGEETTKRAQEGPNAVQGAADIEKQKTPETSAGAETVEGVVQDKLERSTGKK